jgi:hypothetical protein
VTTGDGPCPISPLSSSAFRTGGSVFGSGLECPGRHVRYTERSSSRGRAGKRATGDVAVVLVFYQVGHVDVGLEDSANQGSVLLSERLFDAAQDLLQLHGINFNDLR